MPAPILFSLFSICVNIMCLLTLLFFFSICIIYIFHILDGIRNSLKLYLVMTLLVGKERQHFFFIVYVYFLSIAIVLALEGLIRLKLGIEPHVHGNDVFGQLLAHP